MIDLEVVPVGTIPTPDDLLRMIAVKRAELDALKICLHSVIAYRREYLTAPSDQTGEANDAKDR